jgi:cytochrome b involved in lipid metabolism
VILVAGLFVPTSFLSLMSGSKTSTGGAPIIAVDRNGSKIDALSSGRQEGGTNDATPNETTGTTQDPTQSKESGASTTAPNSQSSPQPTAQTPKPSIVPTPTPTAPPAPAPTPAAPACGSGGPCTAAQVAAHNTQANCWVIYNNKVYNVTGFVSRHQGGRDVFNGNTCGRDISSYISGAREPTSGKQYKHSSSQMSDINPYYVANLG